MLKADVVGVKSFAPVFAAGEQNVDEGLPVVQVGGDGLRRLRAATADGNGGRPSVIPGQLAKFGGQRGQVGEDVRREGLFQPRELRADGVIEGQFEAREYLGVQVGVVEFALGKREQVAQLVA